MALTVVGVEVGSVLAAYLVFEADFALVAPVMMGYDLGDQKEEI